MAKKETLKPEDFEAKANELMLQHNLQSILMTTDGRWFSSSELAEAHNLQTNGEKPIVFNLKTE